MNAKTTTSLIEYLRPQELRIPRMSRILSAAVLASELLFSIGLPLVGLLIYMNHAEANGIKLETGCEGPGIPFGMLSGILFALIQRLKLSSKTRAIEQ